MELIPAIDLLDGKVVRLHQGKYDEVTVYDDDPVSMAKRFEDAGAGRLHVVDLEGRAPWPARTRCDHSGHPSGDEPPGADWGRRAE